MEIPFLMSDAVGEVCFWPSASVELVIVEQENTTRMQYLLSKSDDFKSSCRNKVD